jgi:hypothetical protein
MNDYETHAPILKLLMEEIKPKQILEFGLGNYSTPILFSDGATVESIEMQSQEWFDLISIKFKDKTNWTPYFAMGPFEYRKIKLKDRYDLVLVDGHGDSRWDCVNMMFGKSDVIVAHDTEQPTYNWDKIQEKEGYVKITYKKLRPYTSVWTNNLILSEIIREFCK